MLKVSGSKQSHGTAKRMTSECNTLLLVLFRELLDLLKDMARNTNVCALETFEKFRARRECRAKQPVRLDLLGIKVVHKREEFGCICSLKCHNDTQALGLEDDRTLNEIAVAILVQKVCITDRLVLVLVGAVRLLSQTCCLTQALPVLRNAVTVVQRLWGFVQGSSKCHK